MRKTIGKAALGSALLLGLSATPAHAQPSTDTKITILDAAKGSCSNGSAAWEVRPRIVIQNTSEDNATFASVFYTGKYNAGGSGQTQTNNTRVINDGGFRVGVTVPAGASRTFTPTVGITIPCNATGASLFENHTLQNRDKTYFAGAEFVTGGTAVPVGAIGAVGLASAIGVALFVRRRFNGTAVMA